MQIAIAVALAGLALVVAWLIQRRQAQPAAGPAGYPVPPRLERDEFDRPDAPWLVAVFTSATCGTCVGVWGKALQLASHDVAVCEVEYGSAREVHERYGIEAVPMVLVADADGDVAASFLGEVTATDLWATVAELREPGSVPPGCDHHGSAE